ncbi:flavonoid 3',5'-hydroxylase [Pseudovirgaria hyperparasitica]|uniref:Flavonoid 3',5'-hydroxylase n=1 Tax=Pseudovirgaria hyperparasitica TaxID=470096 RepID=A0A6A6VUZ0_9PEZI|nr:flavonoid 3',5'-hydroxylase [Pseudovirgaria hyperparasitica]KAF2753440.1 flavonoid 3',5'-hydroxylase [Pseudovirgaria hyperparasitica]
MALIQQLSASNAWQVLTLQNVLLVLFLLLLLSVAYQVVYNRFFHPLSKFPGPYWASVTRLYTVYHSIVGDAHLNEYEAVKKYGPVVRMSPSLLLIRDATMLPEVYHRYANRSPFYLKNMLGKGESILTTRDWRQHAQLRRVAGGAYAFSNIKKMEPIFDANISRWTKKMHTDFAVTGREFDFAPWAAYMTNDVLSDVGFGGSFGFVSQGKDIENLITDFRAGLTPFGIMSSLYPLTNWLRSTRIGERFLIASPNDSGGWGRVMHFRDQLIAARRRDMAASKPRAQTDLLQIFLDARDDAGNPLAEEQIKADLLLILLAGADTTGTAICSILDFLTSSPAIYAKLVAEIAQAEQLHAGFAAEVPSFDEVTTKCPYFVACVKESLRLRPSAPSIFPRVTREGGLMVGDIHIPAGTEVSCQAWISNRDPEVYGADADTYKPERWLEGEEKTRVYERYLQTFGYNTRSCLGKDIALMELYKGLLQFFRMFDVEKIRSHGPPEFRNMGGVMVWSNIWLKISPRHTVQL